MKKIDIATIPQLGTNVGIVGSSKQAEVAGPYCLGALIGLAIFVAG